AILVCLLLSSVGSLADSFPWRPSVEDGRQVVEDGTWAGKAVNERAWAVHGTDMLPWEPTVSRRDALLLNAAANVDMLCGYFINQRSYSNWPPESWPTNGWTLWTSTGLWMTAIGEVPDITWLMAHWREQRYVWDSIRAAISLMKYSEPDERLYLSREGNWRYSWLDTQAYFTRPPNVEFTEWVAAIVGIDPYTNAFAECVAHLFDCFDYDVADIAPTYILQNELLITYFINALKVNNSNSANSAAFTYADLEGTIDYSLANIMSSNNIMLEERRTNLFIAYREEREGSASFSGRQTNGEVICGYTYHSPAIYTNKYETTYEARPTKVSDWYLASPTNEYSLLKNIECFNGKTNLMSESLCEDGWVNCQVAGEYCGTEYEIGAFPILTWNWEKGIVVVTDDSWDWIIEWDFACD
ncbi:MAG: hypothetical protein KKC51_14305, partial [Verrucomicrobia bacterium]|nr:hypothetical protein [Verrucomicrobiota bacterium]